MSAKEYKPYVPVDSNMPEFTFKAVFLGVIMAVVLGAANAYLGLKAGMTVAATFPAAVVGMAVLRAFKGNILEENIARTTASVGEALVAGAIFTIPAFVMVEIDGKPLWETLPYFKSSAAMIVGGVLGVLFVTLLRRSLVQEADLPFPESVACAEIVKAGQKGSTGASYVFGAMGLAALIELIKNPRAYQLFKSSTGWFWKFKTSIIKMGGHGASDSIQYNSGFYLNTPLASPALVGVGYIIGPRLAMLNFSGGVLAWWVLVPMLIFFNPHLVQEFAASGSGSVDWNELGHMVFSKMVKPMAVGAMIVSAFYTMFKLRNALVTGISKAVQDMRARSKGESILERTDRDIPLKHVLVAVGVLFVLMIGVYELYCSDIKASITAAIVMLIAGFLFAAVAGYIVGVIGSSSNPISGMTLSTLLIAALLMVILGVKGAHGVAAVLGVAAVVCCSAGIAGDMTQDLKVGHILGGTPWKMELGEMIGVIIAGAVMVFPIIWLHKAYGLGGNELPAPQAGLMALMAKGIVTQKMAWPLVIFGMMLGVALILLGAASPMIIAVGMYLPFGTVAAIFVGGIIKWILDLMMKSRKIEGSAKETIENKGTLLASGLVAGEALLGVIIALFVILGEKYAFFKKAMGYSFYDGAWPALLVFGLLAFILIWLPLKDAAKE